jgi:hypothetical protein
LGAGISNSKIDLADFEGSRFWRGSIKHRPDMSNIWPMLKFVVTEHEIRDRLNTSRKIGVGFYRNTAVQGLPGYCPLCGGWPFFRARPKSSPVSSDAGSRRGGHAMEGKLLRITVALAGLIGVGLARVAQRSAVT